MKFISKDLAIKLKEKSFNKPCFGWYDNQITDSINLYLNVKEGDYTDLLEYTNDFEWIIDAPTIEQVLEWLRDEKNVHIGIVPYFTMSTKNNIMWQWEILLIGKIIECKNTLYVDKDYNYTKLASADCYANYEDACIYAIEFIVNNLI